MVLCSLAAAGATHAERVVLEDARTAALGANPALDPGFYALETNGAALAELTHYQFTFGHKIYAAPHTALEIAGAAVPLGDYGTFAGGFGTLRVGEVEQYGANGEPLGTYVLHDDRLAGGYGVRPIRWLAVGGVVNYERHVTAPDLEYTTFGADAGIYTRPFGVDSGLEQTIGTLAVGVALRNVVATRREIYSGDYREPFALNVGGLWRRDVGNHNLALTFGLAAREPVTASLGCEFTIAAVVAARAGVTGTRPAGGLGVNTNLFSFDYSYITREFGPLHYLTVSVNPGRDLRSRSKRRRQIEAWLAEGRQYFEAGNYDLAAERFAAVLNWDPHDEGARQYWMRSKYQHYMAEGNRFLEQKDWGRARAAFRGALVAMPEDFLATESLARADQLEEEEKARLAEEQRLADLLAQAESYKRRGAYRRAISMCEEILASRPDHEGARKLAGEARRLLAASTTKTLERLPPKEIPAEAVKKYREASAAFDRGSLGTAIRSLEDLIVAYPSYGAARGKLVEAYTYQGLDFYSKGSLSAAVRVWGRGLALDPGNEKLKRYLTKAEKEIDQIR